MTDTVSPRRPRKDAAANRAGLLSAAARTLALDPSASVDAIARAAGLSRRALYGHFDDRDALVRELVASGAQRFNAIATDPGLRLDTESVPVALARLTGRLWGEASHVQVAAAVALDERHVEDSAAALAPLRRALMNLVRRGQDEGTLRTDVAAPTLARLIEETARTVIVRLDASSPEAHSLVVRAVLSIAGLSWRDAAALIDAHSDVVGAAS
ncbi:MULTISPECIES: TetR/AcrR family transcriptional regulator [Microbacterium]|uniref:TetR/AcrR family transcriptional regulator n=1 Tax=Microbacterium TaxID=33882 RepID=UPI000E711C06|nr:MULTISPECIES: TetR/AcrR family transcriptional regulator [Microbacterium]RKE64610.1 TetR family transcriptional regulator [Microbacterium sp. AG238]WJM15798.1 helix-turn-helix domain-containing protein [Microbacterium arborescens]